MIPIQMLLIPRILLHGLVMFQALEDDLTEAVKVRDVAHLAVEELRHEGAGGGLVVDLQHRCISREGRRWRRGG